MLTDALESMFELIIIVLVGFTLIMWVGQAMYNQAKKWSEESRKEEENQRFIEYEDEWLRINRD